MTSNYEPVGRSRKRTLMLVAVVVAAVLLGAVAVSAAMRNRNEPTTPSGARPTPSPTQSPTPTTSPPGADIRGPLNFLLVGVDTRVSQPGWEPKADAVLVAHIPQGLQRAYLFSLPRDLLVDIPAFPKSGFAGRRSKLTHAMSYGSRVPSKPGKPDPAQGYQLLAATVSDYTGIERFDAGAVLNFGGFEDLVNALGGVDLEVDQQVVSRHRQPNGRHRSPAPGGGGYVGPQMSYEPGLRHLNGWQALDYARQRYIDGGDYARQRHQEQLVKAMMRKIVAQNLARAPGRIDQIVQSLGNMLIFSTVGPRLIDFAYALGDMRPDDFVLVGLPGRGVGTGSNYQGEKLDPVGREFLTELQAGRVEAFLAANPTLLVSG